MKGFEAQLLISAAEKQAKGYNHLREQFLNLKKAFHGVADLSGFDFSGKGADNIKAFFQDYGVIADSWLDMIDMNCFS